MQINNESGSCNFGCFEVQNGNHSMIIVSSLITYKDIISNKLFYNSKKDDLKWSAI